MTQRMDALIFDLDGTLWDTCDSCAIAWNNVVRRHGIDFREIVAEDVRRVTGLPHEVCIRNTFEGLPEDQIISLIRDTETEDNAVIAELGGTLYPGVIEGLRVLAEEVPLAIVSNCQSGYIEGFLTKYSLEPFFQDYECWGNTKQSKSQNLALVIDRNHWRTPTFVGDTEGDGIASRDCKVPFWYVKYGFGQCREASKTFGAFSELVDTALTSVSG